MLKHFVKKIAPKKIHFFDCIYVEVKNTPDKAERKKNA